MLTYGTNFAAVFIAVLWSNAAIATAAGDESEGRKADIANRQSTEMQAPATDDIPVAATLETIEQEVCGEALGVTGTGVIWTYIPDEAPRFHDGKRVPATKRLHLGYDNDLESIYKPAAENRIAYFDQGKWHKLEWDEPLGRHDSNGPYGRIVAGIDNTVLVVGSDKTLLIRGDQVVDSGELLEVLKLNQEVVSGAFGPGAPHAIRRDRWNNHTMIAADLEGKIWCLHDMHLCVLTNDTWIDCREPLIEAGSRKGLITFLIPGPGHRFLFVGDQNLRHDGGSSQLVSFENQTVKAVPTHHAIRGMGHYPAIRERNDALWIASPAGYDSKVCDTYTGQLAVRIGRNAREPNPLSMAGYPLLSDPIGNVWLGSIRGGPQDQFNIVREGKIIQQLKAPVEMTESTYNLAQYSYNADYVPLYCDSPGSVFMHTKTGLLHYVAERQPPYLYHAEQHYRMRNAKRLPVGFSSQGYCITMDAGDRTTLKRIYLTKLP